MPDITIANLAAADLDALAARARRLDRSVEDEVRQLIRDAAREERASQELERATASLDRELAQAERTLARGGAARPRRYRSVEPTPGRRR